MLKRGVKNYDFVDKDACLIRSTKIQFRNHKSGRVVNWSKYFFLRYRFFSELKKRVFRGSLKSNFLERKSWINQMSMDFIGELFLFLK